MHDVLIIGCGPAGLSAALWCDQLGLDTLVLEQHSEIGGQLLRIYNPIGNYLGLSAKNGRDLRDLFSRQMDEADFDIWTGVEIERLDIRGKSVTLKSGEELKAISLVLATGARRRRLGVPGEFELAGHGIIDSAARDREALAGKDVCVVGGGDAAVENALLLAEVCPSVVLVHRGKRLGARREFVERLHAERCLTTFTEAVVQRIIGETEVQGVEILRRGAIKPMQIAVAGVLIRIGVEPATDYFRGQLRMDEKGYIVVDSQQETSVENVFAIGDVSNPLAPTISGAIGAGATAAKVISSRLKS